VTGGTSTSSCIFCDAAAADSDAPLVLHRSAHGFVILNLFPYNNGHLMIVPRRHIASLVEANPAELQELIDLMRRAEIVLTEAYAPQGLNIGVNLGGAAGAGVVPRWGGDTNFMTVVGTVRVLPETLDQTADRLRPLFEKLATPTP